MLFESESMQEGIQKLPAAYYLPELLSGRNGFRNPEGQGRFLFFKTSKLVLGPTHWTLGEGLFSREVNPAATRYRFLDMNEWSHNSSPKTYLQGTVNDSVNAVICIFCGIYIYIYKYTNRYTSHITLNYITNYNIKMNC